MAEITKSQVFRDRLRGILKEQKIKQVDLAKSTGLNARTINRWLKTNDGSMPRSDTLFALSEFLNVSVDYLLGEETLEESDKKIAIPKFQKGDEGFATIDDFSILRKKARNLKSIDDYDLDAAEAFVKAMQQEIEKERGMRTAQKSGVA